MPTLPVEILPLPTGEGEFVILRGLLAEEVVRIGGKPEREEGYSTFDRIFTVDPQYYLGDPHEQHLFGTRFTRLIRRRSDGAIFGATFVCSPGDDEADEYYGDSRILDRLDVAWADEDELPIAFLPVRQFVRVGYELIIP